MDDDLHPLPLDTQQSSSAPTDEKHAPDSPTAVQRYPLISATSLPSSTVTVDIALTTADDVCRHIPALLGWPPQVGLPSSSSSPSSSTASASGSANAAAATVTPMSGGMINQVFKLEQPPCAPVIVRLFGRKAAPPTLAAASEATDGDDTRSDKALDQGHRGPSAEAAVEAEAEDADAAAVADARARENSLVCHLADAGLAPAIPLVFANGRVEQFICATPLTLAQLSHRPVLAAVAREMARFHRFRPPHPPPAALHTAAAIAHTMPFQKLAEYRARAETRLRRPRGDGRREEKRRLCLSVLARARSAFSKWMAEFRRQQQQHADRLANLNSEIRGDGDGDAGEWKKKKEEKVERLHIVFAHNDLNPYNIMRHDDGSVSFIDFEFAGWNFKACEIALYFGEALGDGVTNRICAERYPAADVVRAFCSTYLREEQEQEQALERGDSNGEAVVDDAAVDQLVAVVRLFEPFTHLLWGFWALAYVEDEEDEAIDYLDYAQQRLNVCYQLYNWL